MSPSLQTMGFFMSDINFCNTKEQLNHLGEVVTGKVDGSPTGADIDTSTLSYTGQVRKTLPALEQEYLEAIQAAGGEALNGGVWVAGQTFTAYNQFMVYSGVPYKPLTTTTLPYGPTGSTPDTDFVGPYSDISKSEADSRYVIFFIDDNYGTAVENMVAGRVAGVVSVTHKKGNTYYSDEMYECLSDSATSISDFKSVTELEPTNVSQNAKLSSQSSRIGVNEIDIEQLQDDLASLSPFSWYQKGDGVAFDFIIDTTNSLGLSLTSDDVDSFVNLGKMPLTDLTPSGATKSKTAIYSGYTGVTFDGGGVYDYYAGAGAFAAGLFSVTKKHAQMAVWVSSDVLSDQVPASVGVLGSNAPRLNLRANSNGLSMTATYNDGTTNNEYVKAPRQRQNNELNATASFHDGVSKATMWSNGAVVALDKDDAILAGQNALSGDTITLGSTGGGAFPLNGGLLVSAIDNNETLSFDATYEKYKGIYNRFKLSTREASVIRCIGQSNAEGNFTNPNKFEFDAEEAYLKQTVGSSSQGVFLRDGFGQGTNAIAESCLGVWFADEWEKLTSRTPLFQVIAIGGTPVTPATISAPARYWAPKNPIGDAAGQTSMIEDFYSDFKRMTDLYNYSPEFKVVNDIALVFEGEADAIAYTAGDPAVSDRSVLVAWMESMLDTLVSEFGVKTFAIVNIGRNGNTESIVNSNKEGVDFVREAWLSVISSRTDSYDVFPHLNHQPSPFVIDDLVTASDGSWISGQANNPDGLHYTPEMYQAIARTSARNLFAMIR